ncbi:hypothetical protein RI129_009105 [Pyrocoelia pectoralis]|uniref:LITAF domain-containing protein n=1 Tax=Pyrocoelia pectoralis TaxID=417401 RepID=A0AAN7ZKQ9_9COLE
MVKDAPPPYSETAPPNIGFNVPSINATSAPVHTIVQAPGQPIFAPPVVANVPVVSPAFGPHPQPVNCPYCHQQTTSRTLNEPSTRTHLMAVLLCLIGCIPCCLIPYCMGTCQNKNHYCANCSVYLGTYIDGGRH